MDEVTHDFAVTSFTRSPPDFSQYHHFEEYNPQKNYDTKPYKADYGHGELRYINQLYRIGTAQWQVKYVIAHEQLSDDECRQLSKFCQCPYHLMSWFNLMWIFTGKIGVGCLHAGPLFCGQRSIDQTRAYMKSKL